jgi:hypothetical protein
MSAMDNDPTDKRAPESDVYTDKVDTGYVESNAAPPEQSLQRQLKNRHIAMIRYFQLFPPLVRTFVESFFCVHLVLEVRDHYENLCS